MNKCVHIFLLIFAFLVRADAQVFRPMGIRYNNPSVKGNIVYVSNNSVTTPAAITTEAPPGGTATNNGNPGDYLDVDTDVPAHTVKMPFNSVWNYHSNGAAPANDGSGRSWINPAYVMPAAWNVNAIPVNGAGKYGYSNPANPTIATCIKSSAAATACAPAAVAKYTAYYFRRTVNFTAPELAAFSTVLVNMRRNDGAVVYVNGVERLRTNMPAGVIGYGTLATNNIAMGAAENYTFNLDPAFLVAGANTIAVEIHLQNASNTNMSFDMQMLGIDRNSSFSSTSANLALNPCSQVLWAGLYWGANHQSGTTSDTAWIKQERSVKLRVPGSSTYQIVTSVQNDYHNATRLAGLNHAGYFCFADITSLINTNNANGTYTVADIVAPVNFNSCGAGWTIAIAYANSSEIQRNITIFDGSAVVKIGSPDMFVPIAGFLTPPSGPVSCELGVVAYDGDRGVGLSDNFYFKQDSNRLVGVYTNLTPNATSGLNDMFNSTISNKGVVPGPLLRNPAHNNTLGYDADIIEIPNAGNVLLGNSRTSASIRLSSTVEDFFVQLITTSVSIYNPSYAFEKTATDINGGAFIPGDSLLYKIKFTNHGNDSSINTVIIDNLPSGAAFIPGSIKIGTVAKSDGLGDDQAEYDFTNNRINFRIGVGATSGAGGRVGPGTIDSVEFKVVSPSSCAIIACEGTLRNSARINYAGKLSGSVLYDSTGVNTTGCIIKGPVITPMSGTCATPRDTVLVNRCTSAIVLLPYARYAGYTFYSAMPFIPANIYNQYLPVTTTGIYWAYYSNGFGCSDTARIAVIITNCPDIDDDNDGLPDYVEFDNSLALSGAPQNWNNPAYPGYVDFNSDLVNDNFDWGADADNDRIPNFYDTDFWIAFVDVNNDGVNDRADKDLDGIPNQYDLDSDNDGIPDTVESYGVDTNGNGLIDNYTDTDNDGFSQNVDGSGGGVNGSGNGLGPIDLDGDGIPNYLDLDSDNDGIPDLVEALGPDANNDAKIDAFADANSDGFADNYILGSALLITGVDLIAPFGRADNWPNKNLDRDLRPNAYDLDSDGDGIVDVIEAGLPDANLNGIVDGVIGANGWSTTVSGMPALNLRNTDGIGNFDFIDIDSDEDGIPDNIEGQATAAFAMPTLTDADGDGLMLPYDNQPAVYGGTGIAVYDHDGDATPDYRDFDSDADGLNDRVEGNDYNLNGLPDDLVTPTGVDTDGDGLDNRYDSLNSVTNIKGTSYLMGNGGSFTGDATPGSRTTVQRTLLPPFQVDRDWRFSGFVLPVQFVNLAGQLQVNKVSLSWTVIAAKPVDRFEVERSTDNSNFVKTGTVTQLVKLNEQQTFSFKDDIAGVNKDVLYYRIKVVSKTSEIQYSNRLLIRRQEGDTRFNIMPNPANDFVSISFFAQKEADVTIRLFDSEGKMVLTINRKVIKGSNTLPLSGLSKYSNGFYTMQLFLHDEVYTQSLLLWK